MSIPFEPFPPGWRKCVFRRLLRDRVKPILLAVLTDDSTYSYKDVEVSLDSVIREVKAIVEVKNWLGMQYRLYGIPNCDKMKKARNLLGEAQVSFLEINYKKAPPLKEWLIEVSQHIPLHELINVKGTTFKQSELKLELMSGDDILEFLQNHPSAIKRPLLFKEGVYFLGLDNLASSLGVE